VPLLYSVSGLFLIDLLGNRRGIYHFILTSTLKTKISV